MIVIVHPGWWLGSKLERSVRDDRICNKTVMLAVNDAGDSHIKEQTRGDSECRG